MIKRIADLTLNYSNFVIGVFVILTLVFTYGLTKLELDESLDVMMPDESPVTELNEEISDTFGEQPPIAIALLEGEIYTPEALEAVRNLTAELATIDGVIDVVSVANSEKTVEDEGFLLFEDLLPVGEISEARIADLKNYLQSAYVYRDGLLVSNDGRYATIIIETEDEADFPSIIGQVRQIFEEGWSGEVFLAGQPAMLADLQTTLQRDLPLLTMLAAGLILVFLFLNFRTLRGALLPLMTIIIGLIWSLGALALFGLELTTMSVIAPVAILAVGSSFSLHLLGRYYFELARGVDKSRAIRLMLGETGLGVIVSGIAITAAMLTFLISEIQAVRGLGLSTALGVFSSLLASMFLLPAVMTLLTPPKRLVNPEEPGPIKSFLQGLSTLVSRQRYLILGLGGVIAVVAVLGASRITTNTAPIDFFPANSPTRASFDVVEEVFGGSSQVQIRVTGDLGDPELLSKMLRFQEEAREIEGVGPSTSIATIYRNLHEVLAGEEGMPDSREAAAQELLIYQMSGDVQDITGLVTLDNSQGIINVTTATLSTSRTREVIEELQGLADEIFAGAAELEYAGLALDTIYSEQAIRKDFIVSLTLAILLVIIIDSFVRSVRAAVVTILALLITIALQYGVLGYLGVDLDIATMLLGALAIGVGDYAIHLTVRYMEERRTGLEPEAAMEASILSSGRAILFTALTLGAGFAPLMLGGMVPIQRLGILMVVTVMSVGVASLTLLPAACLTFLRNPPNQRVTSVAEVPST